MEIISIDFENKMSNIYLIGIPEERDNTEKKKVENFPKPLKFFLIILFELISFQNLKHKYIG